MYWINNDQSGRQKVIDDIDNLILKLNRNDNRPVLEIGIHSHLNNIWAMHKLQCLSFMYDFCNNNVHISLFFLATNDMLHNHTHFTRTSINIHINTVSTLDLCNFVYNCVICWNECSIEIRVM
jgi:hypothetical protein